MGAKAETCYLDAPTRQSGEQQLSQAAEVDFVSFLDVRGSQQSSPGATRLALTAQHSPDTSLHSHGNLQMNKLSLTFVLRLELPSKTLSQPASIHGYEKYKSDGSSRSTPTSRNPSRNSP